MKLPFSANPTTWFLSQEDKQIARIHHQYPPGKERERQIIEWRFSGRNTPDERKEYQRAILYLNHKYGDLELRELQEKILHLDYAKKSTEFKLGMLEIKYEHADITQYEFDIARLELTHKDHESAEFSISKAEIDLKYEKINQQQFDKAHATAKGEPYVVILEAGIEYTSEGSRMGFELDWNQPFVDDLRQHGWTGRIDSDVVDQWFTNICMDMMNPDMDLQPEDSQPTATTRKTDLGGDKTEYS